MNTLQRLLKFLDQHRAQLTIDARAEHPELLLRIPAQTAANGQILHYATEYRLGAQLPPSTPPQPELLESDPTA